MLASASLCLVFSPIKAREHQVKSYCCFPAPPAGRRGSAGGVALPEGRLPHGLQEAVGGDRRSQAAPRARQPAVRRRDAALGRRPDRHHRGDQPGELGAIKEAPQEEREEDRKHPSFHSSLLPHFISFFPSLFVPFTLSFIPSILPFTICFYPSHFSFP